MRDDIKFEILLKKEIRGMPFETYTYIVDGFPIGIICLRLCEKSPNICVFVLS